MDTFNFDKVLIDFEGKDRNDEWTIRNAMEGVQIFGGIGSGKSTGSGEVIAKAYLKNNFGGLVLTCKSDERAAWEKYCADTGRLNDLIVIEPGGKNFFNFLQYESENSSRGTSLTQNIVHVLKTVLNASNTKDKGTSDDSFWTNALDALLSNVIDLDKLASGHVTIPSIYSIVQSIPKAGAKVDDDVRSGAFYQAMERARTNITAKIESWEQSIGIEVLNDYNEKGINAVMAEKAISEIRTLRMVDEFFLVSFIPLAEKTRSIIEFSFTGFLNQLLSDPVYTLFISNTSTVTPEDCLAGKIIVIDLPVKIYGKVGRDAQIMFKYIWQRAMERRDTRAHPRPVFLFADEAQNFIHEYDADYQATARGSRIATTYITQNMANYIANMGGDKSHARVTSFLGTLNTKLFHANSDIETNQYASQLIGEIYYEKIQQSANIGTQMSQGNNRSMELKRAIRPEAFARLATGGPQNDFIVEGYLNRQGKPFTTGRNTIKVKFRQHI